jgi:LuxR family maltose regulon positive regulatory protein
MVLAIEDYKLISSPDIQAGLILWWSSWTRRDHVVVMTRAEPPFPLPRWRVRGEVTGCPNQSRQVLPAPPVPL